MRIIRRPELRNAALASLAAGLAIMALCLLLVVRTSNTQAFRRQAAHNCESIEAIKTNIRETFMVSMHRALERDNLDAGQRAAVVAAYEKELERYAPTKCPSP